VFLTDCLPALRTCRRMLFRVARRLVLLSRLCLAPLLGWDHWLLSQLLLSRLLSLLWLLRYKLLLFLKSNVIGK